jgi:hypothetical protein
MGLHIFRPFLLHQILTLTLIYSCRALTQQSRNHQTEITTPEAGILLDQPSSNPRTNNLRSILVHHSPKSTSNPRPPVNQPSFNHQPTLTQPSPSPHRTLILPSTTLIQHSFNPHQHPTLAQPSPNPLPTLAHPSSNPHPTFTRLSLVYSRPSLASNNRYLSIK